MDYRTPLQHLLQRFLLSRAHASARAPAQDFEDTRPDDSRTRRPAVLRQVASVARSESAIDLVLGTEVMEYPDETASGLMDEFFANAEKRAA
jgi:hypothetical protein